MNEFRFTYCGKPEGKGHESVNCGEFYYGEIYQCMPCKQKDIDTLLSENEVLRKSGFNAVDMATAAADGFRDGAVSREAEIETLKAENESLGELYDELREMWDSEGGR